MKTFDATAEFVGAAVFPSIFARPTFVRKNLLNIFAEEGIIDPQVMGWYSTQKLANFYQKVLKQYGPNTLFDLGKAVPETAVLPDGLDTLEKLLAALPMTYDMNHRNGYVGFLKIVSHDVEEKKIIVQSYTPYASDFTRGFLTAFIRMFRVGVRTTRDDEKSSEGEGYEDNWYTITYR